MNYSEAMGVGLALGVANMAHCAGMCGPFAIHAATSRPTRGIFANFSAYFSGKTFSYLFLGSMAGWIGAQLTFSNEIAKSMLGCLAGALSVITAIGFVAAPEPAPSSAAGGGFSGFIGRIKPSGGPGAGSLTGFTYGALTGLIPCGVVYLAAVQGAASGSFAKGFVLMAAFALGTGPILAVLGFGGRKIARLLTPVAWRWTGVTLMLAAGGITLWRSLGPWLADNGGRTVCCH